MLPLKRKYRADLAGCYVRASAAVRAYLGLLIRHWANASDPRFTRLFRFIGSIGGLAPERRQVRPPAPRGSRTTIAVSPERIFVYPS